MALYQLDRDSRRVLTRTVGEFVEWAGRFGISLLILTLTTFYIEGTSASPASSG
jgi:hypothetical protein